MPPSITIGTVTAGIIQFIIFMGILQPAVNLVTPAQFTAVYYGNSTNVANSIVNGTFQNFNRTVQMPLTQEAQGSSGFNAINPQNLGQGGFGGLAFIIGFFPQFFNNIFNFPGFALKILEGSLAYLPGGAVPFQIVVLLQIGIFSYLVTLIIYKAITFVTKTHVEET